MKWDVINGALVASAGPNFIVSGAQQMTNYPDIHEGAAPEASASFVGESIRIGTRSDCVLVDFVIKQGPCAVNAGAFGLPSPGTTGPWTFTPLASPPNC